jgi:hypothetical protein
MSEFRPGWHGASARGPRSSRSADDPQYKYLQSLLGNPDLLGNADDLMTLTKALNAGSPVDPEILTYFKKAYSAEQNSIDVKFRRPTRVKNRHGRTVEYRCGEGAVLDEGLARALYAAGTVNTTDPTEVERRALVRLCAPEGRETRVCRKGAMSLPAG